jgi:hypothetical protein
MNSAADVQEPTLKNWIKTDELGLHAIPPKVAVLLDSFSFSEALFIFEQRPLTPPTRQLIFKF